MNRAAAPARPLRLAACVLAGALVLVGCGGELESSPDGTANHDEALAALPEAFDGRWQGVLPCVDCAGLEVELLLRRAPGEASRFLLVERYLGGASAGEFNLKGEWREETCALGGDAGRCIVLVDAGQQWFRGKDGSLQAVSSVGLPLDADGARLLRL